MSGGGRSTEEGKETARGNTCIFGKDKLKKIHFLIK
jgi:hypothetical protein